MIREIHVQETANPLNSGIIAISPDGRQAAYMLVEEGCVVGTVFIGQGDFHRMTDHQIIEHVARILY